VNGFVSSSINRPEHLFYWDCEAIHFLDKLSSNGLA